MWHRSSSSSSLHLALLVLAALTSTTISQQVPLSIANKTSNANKVPTDLGVVEGAAGFMPLQQTSASIFFANYNQQNVMQLRHNMESKLRSIRNVEMRVAKIQEIFDSIHFSSANGAAPARQSFSNDSAQANPQLQRDLKLFSKRLSKKLLKATHLVLELRDLFRYNLSKVLQYSYEDEDEELESEFDMDSETEELHGKKPDSAVTQHQLYLNTQIESCQPEYESELDAAAASATSQSLHYNKQQIQILNYLKSDDTRGAFLNENNARSLAVNGYIADQLFQLKRRLSLSDAEASNTSGNHFKHIYFLSNSDGAPVSQHFRQLYVSAIKQKFVLLLIDVGSALNAELFELTKNFVHELLQLLEDTDKVSLVTVASEANFMALDAFPAEAVHGVYSATRAHKEEILSYVNSLSRAHALTNHTLGFEYSFQLLRRLQKSGMLNTAEQPVEFVYVTRGLLTNLSDAMAVLRVVAEGQSHLKAPVIINTCAVVLDEKRIMYEKQFLSDVATQNYTKYEINVTKWWPTGRQPAQLAGRFFVLSKMHAETLLPQTSSRIFGQLFVERYLTDTLEVHPPIVDAESGDVLVSITHAVPPYGVVGVNLYLADLLEDLLNYPSAAPSARQGSGYAFLLERSSGNTLAHPAFPRPLIQRETSYPVNIAYLENATDFSSHIRQRLLREETGNATTDVYVGQQRLRRTYHWKSVLGIYVLCLVSSGNDGRRNDSTQRYNLKDTVSNYEPGYYGESMDLLYHRLDLHQGGIAMPKICRYFRQMATMDAPTLFLSAAAFESPFGFLHNNRPSTQLRHVENIMAYLKEPSDVLANPGLRPSIRHEVSVLYQALQQLRRRHQDARGSLREHIIRRYMASVSGVLQLYPGCLLSSSYDPTRRPWFRQAMAQPGKIVSTAPYLDAGGAGYIVTLAHTIFEGKAHALHSAQQDRPVGVVALDVPYAFYYRLIVESTPLCQLPHMKCLIFEHEGYLLAHPSMLQPATPTRNQRRPHEHLTHKESYLANDMLNHGQLVRKLGCTSYQNRTLQRYYAFNTSLASILGNVVHGERTKYAIALIRGSNLFAAVLNSSCDGGAFCPCSTIDRECLNCKRMDQTDCECPCECPMVGDGNTSSSFEYYANYTQHFPYCLPPSEHFVALPPTTQLLSALPSCMVAGSAVAGGCELYSSQRECLGVMGCEWCQQDVEGNTFSAAFCAAQASCFNGVLASLTPYGELDELELLAAHNPQREQHAYSAFGPLGGAVVVLAIVIAFAIYCYRHNLDAQAQEQFYVDSVQEENYGLPLSRFNFDDCKAHDEPPLGGGYDHTAAQRQLMHAADISPYHVSTGSSYRRPPNGESDHGYSTMTPHEDSSDQQCFTLAEPLLLNDKRHSKSDTMSISTSISSPTNRQQSTTQPNTHPYLSNQPTTKTERYKHQQLQATPSPCRGAPGGGVYGQTTLPLCAVEGEETRPHYILAPVTVHRHMETAES
ncbi:VWFA and cache domain-containing protein CG16868 [Drosophila guanche]|uniref:Blast:VWFA and cache domain-containing protein CG16868 n=1 Tax=Drosophila guanche TaxID=7266 RepID=A0A3B0JHR5_DROGU|nr:VWFA and cache domain-containing protein CG16868 [Drosophila guanche]SPP72929.1 blast:VWFA and cache domain-containing protein CG16868 [Drosophila guanche]